MPSAVTKPDNKTSPEVPNTISSAIDAVEKKCRNLVKKKGRLEQYREKAASGGVLNADQLKAVGGYDGILANLEFAAELTKLFASMQVEAEKLSVKQLKREAYERQQAELKRLRAVLDLQNLLDSLGPDEVRADLKTGAHGLPVLTEEHITQLDEFYTLINPTRDGETSYADQLSAAAEHLTAYLEGRDKAVVGTTYKAIREMAEKISESGYLDRTPEEPAEEEVVVEEAEDEVAEEQVLVQEEEPCEQQPEPEIAVVEAAVPEYPPAVAELPEVVPESAPAADYGVQMVAPVEQESPEEETFLDTQAPAAGPRQTVPRPFNEIVSSVQGNFNFLQDSEIESTPGAGAALAEAVHLESAPAAAVTHYGAPDTQAFQEAGAAPQYVAPEVTDTHAPYDPAAVEPAYPEQYAAQSLMPQHMQPGAPQYEDGTLTQEGAQSYDQLSDESKKEYTMNPNAEIFNSVYTQAPGTEAVTAEPTYQQAATTQQAPAQPPANAWANTPDFSHTAQSTYGYGAAAAAAPPRRGGSAGPQTGGPQGGGQRNYRGGQQGGGQRQGGQTNSYRGGPRGGQSGGGQRGGQGYGGQRGQQGMASGQRGGGGGYRGRDYQDQGYQGSQGAYNQGYQGGNRGGRGGNGGRGGGRGGGYGGGGRMGGGNNQ